MQCVLSSTNIAHLKVAPSHVFFLDLIYPLERTGKRVRASEENRAKSSNVTGASEQNRA